MDPVLINGVTSAYVSVADRGLHYGDGLFETIACVGTQPLFIEQHLKRLQSGARILDIAFPDRDSILQDINTLLQNNGYSKSIIKLLLTRGQGKRGYRYDTAQIPTRVCMLSAWPEYVAQWKQQGINTRFCETQASINTSLSGIKTLNRLENVLASSELGSQYNEGFLCDLYGNVVEGTMSNIFAVIDGVLVTPDLSRCGIKGIMREQIIASACEIGIGVETIKITRDDLMKSEEIFVSNSVIGLCNVKQLEQRSFNCTVMSETLNVELEKRIDADAKTAAY
jgi:4-amino-4-deoxychorismate lyase